MITGIISIYFGESLVSTEIILRSDDKSTLSKGNHLWTVKYHTMSCGHRYEYKYCVSYLGTGMIAFTHVATQLPLTNKV